MRKLDEIMGRLIEPAEVIAELPLREQAPRLGAVAPVKAPSKPSRKRIATPEHGVVQELSKIERRRPRLSREEQLALIARAYLPKGE